MRALRLHEIGGPENLRIDEIAIPELREDEALVRIAAAALNRRDLFMTQGLYPNIRLPVTLGSDGSGRIAALGSVVSGLNAGDEVLIDPMLAWGEDPSVWDPGASSIFGMPRDGTFAEYVVVPIENCYRKPAGLSMEEAAAIPLAGSDSLSRALHARRRAARRNGAHHRNRRRRADLRAALCQTRGRARDRHVEQRREARARPSAWGGPRD